MQCCESDCACKQCDAVMVVVLLIGVTRRAEAHFAEGWGGGSEARTLGWAAGGRKLACTLARSDPQVA